MAIIVTRAGKGAPLSWNEADANFTNLNTDKLEVSNNLSDVSNPTAAKSNLGLGNVDNTSDINKPISAATQTALDGKVDTSSLSASSGSSLVGFIQSGTGAVATNVQAKLREVVSVKDFGAVGDGVTDDTAAIQLANDCGALSIYFPAGVYLAHGLTMDKPWSMDETATIQFNGSTNTACVTCSGSDGGGNLNLSAGGGSPSYLLNITGNNNRFSGIRVKNLASPVDASVHVAVRIGGNNNVIDSVVGADLTNSGNANASSPQFVTFASTSDKNSINSVYGNNVRCAVLNYSTGANSIGTIAVDDCADNGLYCSQPGLFSVGTIRYSGTDEAVVFINGANASVGTLIVDKAANAAVSIADCGIVEIGTVIVRSGATGGVAKTRDENVSSETLRIDSIRGEYTGGTPFYFNAGAVSHIDIGQINLVYIYDAALAGSIGSWARFNAASSVNIGAANIFVIDKNNALSGANSFVATFPAALSRPSYVGCFNVSILNADRTTLSAAIFQGKNLIQPLMTLGAGFIQANSGPNLRERTPIQPTNGIYANALPTVGTWKQGQVLWRAYPAAGGSPGWVCVAAGTPGTWKDLPAVAA